MEQQPTEAKGGEKEKGQEGEWMECEGEDRSAIDAGESEQEGEGEGMGEKGKKGRIFYSDDS